MDPRNSGTRAPSEVIGVYDADATLLGELSYWVGARLGVRHCALCDVTHGLFRRRAEWDAHCERLGIPFVSHHRNDAPDDVREACGGEFPAVLVREAESVRLILGPAEIAECDASPEALVDRILLRFTD